MKTWHRRSMGDSIDAANAAARLVDLPDAWFEVRGAIGPAVFSSYDSESNTVTWWFSPEASHLAPLFDAEPTEMPPRVEDFSLVAGDARANSTYFPDRVHRPDTPA